MFDEIYKYDEFSYTRHDLTRRSSAKYYRINILGIY